MKVNIGKNTIGDNDKMSVSLREYDRSTHDLSYAWRSSMGIGSLVPCMKFLAMPGDTFSIQMGEKIMTHPTLGPLFGSFKFQVDVFTCPIRLYNAMLHNNALNIGLDMSKVKLPKLISKTNGKTSSSSIYNYLGIKNTKANKKYNAVPLLAVYDIFKNYYANKQEEKFYIITTGTTETQPEYSPLSTKVEGDAVFAMDQMIQARTTWDTYENPNLGVNTAGIIYIKGNFTAAQINKQTSYIEFDQVVNWLNGETSGGYQLKLPLGQCIFEDLTTPQMGKYNIRLRIPSGIKGNYENTNYFSDRKYLIPNKLSLTIEGDLQLQSYNLEKLDDIREEILSKGSQEFVIGEGGNCTNDLFNKLANSMASSSKLYGLPLKTHFSDIFNNWINKEWVDGDNGITALTAIDTSEGNFTIDTLNLAQKVYNLLNRIAISGGTYKDWIETVYTTDYYFRAETPIYEGGMSSEIEFSEVVSTAATEIEGNEPLGSLGGKGYNSNGKGGTVTIKVNEPSYIIALASITPRVDYSQGNDWDNDLDTMNDLHKPQLDGIGYQDLMQKWMHGGANEEAAVGKTVAWINYMTNVNRCYGTFAVGESESFMVLNRVYELGENGEIENLTTYINPKEFTGTFATNEISNQDFWVQIGFKVEARRVMSAKQIPIM